MGHENGLTISHFKTSWVLNDLHCKECNQFDYGRHRIWWCPIRMARYHFTHHLSNWSSRSKYIRKKWDLCKVLKMRPITLVHHSMDKSAWCSWETTTNWSSLITDTTWLRMTTRLCMQHLTRTLALPAVRPLGSAIFSQSTEICISLVLSHRIYSFFSLGCQFSFLLFLNLYDFVRDRMVGLALQLPHSSFVFCLHLAYFCLLSLWVD